MSRKVSNEVKSAQGLFKKSVASVKQMIKTARTLLPSSAVKEMKKDLLGDGVELTKSGNLTVTGGRKGHNDANLLTRAAQALSSKIKSEAEIAAEAYGKYNDYYVKHVMSKRIDKLNRRITQLQKDFGVDSQLYKDYVSEIEMIPGVEILPSGRISKKLTMDNLDSVGGAVVSRGVEASFDAIPDSASILKEILVDIFPNITKQQQKDIMASPKDRHTIAHIYTTISASADNYGDVLKALYAMNPGDMTSAAGADYDDILEQIAHPGEKLSYDEISNNINAINEYLVGLVDPTNI